MPTLISQEYFQVELPQGVQIAIPLEQTAEVFSLSRHDICLIPGVAPSLLGITNQRGRLIWMLELGDLLGLPMPSGRSPQERLTALVMTHRGQEQQVKLGCLVSSLRGIIPIEPEQIQPIPKQLKKQVRQFFIGMAQAERTPLLILKVETVFSLLQRYTLPNSLAVL